MSTEQHFDVIIIGAGAAGLMCSIETSKRERKTLLLDKAEKIGKKILISGGGRCNFTNLYIEPDCYLSSNHHFCKSALARFTQWDFISLMNKHNLSWREKTLGQLFCDQKSKAIVKLLTDESLEAGTQIKTNFSIEKIQKNELFYIETSQGKFSSQSLVIATGGPSIPKMGATDFGLKVASQFKLKTIPFLPALVPFVFAPFEIENLFKPLAGISIEAKVSCGNTSFQESILFTHKGLSGPAILQISSYWKKDDHLHIDLLPGSDILKWLHTQKLSQPKAELKTHLSQLLPKKLAFKFCEKLLPNKPLQQYSDPELKSIAHQLNNWVIKPIKTEGFRTAEVSTGGIDTNELSSKTFESKKVSGLFFIGETVDVTGHLGGFNFQWAWSSGWCAGQYV